MRYSLCSDYSDINDISVNDAIAIVPVKGFNISEKYRINNISIYPKGSLIEDEISGYHYDFSFEEIKDEFFDSTIIAFPMKYERRNVMGVLFPSEKNKLIKKVLETAEDVMNALRYINSNFDKVSNLPQRAGYISGLNSGFLLYYPHMKMSDYIFDKYYVLNISIGDGLNINVDEMKSQLDKYFLPLKNDSYEVGSIIKHAFRLYSDILYMPTATNKFMQAMSLIEYLANPFEYEQMKKAKTKVIPFSSDCKKNYFDLCERFKYLTSLEDENGIQIGLRTSIIHNGKNLEELLDKGYKIDLLLRELQMYICNFINNIVLYSDKEWDLVNTKVNERYEEVQKIKEGYDGKLEADTMIFIDFEFLNKALKEVYQLYPQYIERKFNFAHFLFLLLKQADVERNGYQVPVQIIYRTDEKMFNSNDERNVSQLEELGFNSLLGETSIYTFDASQDYYLSMGKFLKGYLSEKNYNIDCSAKFNNIVWVSDRNNIPHEVFQHAEKSCKKIILGRLDNKRTTCYDVCTWFDVQLVIMACLGIEVYEECEDNFIFKVEDGTYKGA